MAIDDFALREAIEDIRDLWSDLWSYVWPMNRDRSLIRSALDVLEAVALSIGLLVLVSMLQLLLPLVWFQRWSERRRKRMEKQREESTLKQLVLETQSAQQISATPPPNDVDVEDTRDSSKESSIIFSRVPLEIRRYILILAFGNRTVHMDLQWRYPLRFSNQPRAWIRPHAGLVYKGALGDTGQDTGPGNERAWRWFSCVCHRFHPTLQRHLPLGRRANFPWALGCEPHTDRCLEGTGTCEYWTGEWPSRCRIGAIGWLLSCRQAYFEGSDVLYGTNTINITSPILLRYMHELVSQPIMSTIRSLELVWDPKELPLMLGFTGSKDLFALPKAGEEQEPIFPSLSYLRISFASLRIQEMDEAVGLIWGYENKTELANRIHNYLLPTMDSLISRIAPATTDVTVTCSNWEWYEQIDLHLLEKQGKEKTKLQRANIEGLKCWREIPRDAQDEVLNLVEKDDSSSVPDIRGGYWIHVCLEDARLNKTYPIKWYDRHRHELYNLGEKEYQVLLFP